MTTFKKLIMMISAFTLLSVASCKKDNFDEPPFETPDPNLVVTHSIADLKTLLVGATTQITDTFRISGIVVANDKSGNIFNQIIIDDGTAGISVAIDQNALNGEFPVGRKIYVNCKGLYLAADNNLIGLYGAVDITGTPIEIPASLISKYIVKANSGNAVVPIEVADIDDLDNSFQNRLIKLSNVEFDAADADQPYADAVNKQSVSRILVECDNDEIEVRSSGYADFASKLTPKGKGSIIGIYTVYRTDKQLILRDGNETDMNGIKCDGSDPNAITLLQENFNGVSTSGNLAITNWTNFSTAGTKFWYGTGTSNKNARVSAFGSSDASNICWLITPAINFDGTTDEKLNFRNNVSFVAGSTILEILYSTNYSGSGDPSTATWTLLGNVPNTTTSWSAAPTVSLAAISGTSVYIAFRYTGSGAGGSTTQYNIDDLKITGL